MKKVKLALLSILGILAVLAIVAYIFIQSLKPTYDGEIQLENLKETVNVYYDTYGIPHIYAKNDTDGFHALGYVHAQDRLWQMELIRRIGTGRLSEVFGEDMVNTDKLFLSLGIADATEKTIAELDPKAPMVVLANAYLEGINQFISEGPTPVEFYLTGIDKAPFTIQDVYNTMGYMAFSFAMAHKTDPLLTEIHKKLGPAYLKDLAIDANPNTEWIKNTPNTNDTVLMGLSAQVRFALEDLPVPLFEGSNSWVIAPDKTKNGKVLFANDPHIGFSQPSVWFEAHLTTPNYEKYGYHLAGVPFPLLGHDRNLAYGLTMFENDDVDFYEEKLHPTDANKYEYNGEWKSFKEVTKNIKVKDNESISFTYKTSIHGPVMNSILNQVKSEKPLAMWWIYTQEKNEVMSALHTMSSATDLASFKSGLPKIHAPGLNVMYGDAEGNVAWWASAKLYLMPKNTNSKFILDGSSSAQEPLDYLEFDKNPHAENPSWNYVYSANNQPDSIAGNLYPGYYLPENRAKRIVELLENKDDWTAKDMQSMIIDVTSPVANKMAQSLIRIIDTSLLTSEELKALNELKKWNGAANTESIATSIFHRWEYFLLQKTFEDELGASLFNELLATHLIKRTVAPLVENKESVWWDNVSTKEKETMQSIAQDAFITAVNSLTNSFGGIDNWQWKNMHTLEHGHPIGQVEALRSFFNVGPFPVAGTREVINNMAFQYTDSPTYKVTSGPSTRRIIDFSDVENSMSILPTGQSGNPFSPFYKDQAIMYKNGEFRKMMLNKEEIRNTATSLLTLESKEK